ncbi:hypothetical protein pipiens_009144 [Culex pipiens pipiens]|uniref:Uncharacterized protein n=1 Tax=Culex pipiens pipiens TaxID=38569 RepID=A0ABD1DEV4_CULPP
MIVGREAMKKIRRWLLVFAVIITLMVRVDGLKATSLIFGRGPATSSTSTTSSPTAATSTTAASTTSTTTASADDDASEEEEPPIKTFTSRNRKVC